MYQRDAWNWTWQACTTKLLRLEHKFKQWLPRDPRFHPQTTYNLGNDPIPQERRQMNFCLWCANEYKLRKL